MLNALQPLHIIQKRNANIFARLISRKNKGYDPRKRTVITPNERYWRGVVFTMYGVFTFALFIPGSNYSVKSSLNDRFFQQNGQKRIWRETKK